MISKDTPITIGQNIIKVRKSSKLGYRMLEVTSTTEKSFGYRDKNRGKTGYCYFTRSDDFFVTKVEFFMFVLAHIKKSNKYRRIEAKEVVSKQVLEEMESHRKKHAEYWI